MTLGEAPSYHVCIHANTSNSLAGGILTLSTSETTSGTTDVSDRGGERGMGGCCGTCRV